MNIDIPNIIDDIKRLYYRKQYPICDKRNELYNYVMTELDIHYIDENGNNILHHICNQTYDIISYEAVDTLLNFGVDPNKQNNDGDTVLHIACKNIDSLEISILEILLKYGANPNIHNNYGQTPLIILCEADYEDEEDYEDEADYEDKEDYEDEEDYIKYFFERLYDYINLLIINGVDINIQDNSNSTALHSLCDCNKNIIDDRCIKLLIDNGANLNIQDIDGDTPLILISNNSNSYYNIIKLLIENGADPNIQNIVGDTALILNNYGVTTFNTVNICYYLLQHGSDPYLQNEDGLNAFTIENENENLEIVLYKTKKYILPKFYFK